MIQENLKRAIRVVLPFRLRHWLLNSAVHGYEHSSYSQEGEDMVLRRIFEAQRTGFFVDVGAHHPKRFSNTFYFYKRGWRGINIDARPGSMDLFHKVRPKDINLECAVASEQKELIYYMFDEPALNGFSATLSEERARPGSGARLLRTMPMTTRPLRDILQEHVPAGTVIDFLSVDAEGVDLDILRSNDWQRYRPRIVLAEALNSTLESLPADPLVAFMRTQGYHVYGKCVCTVLFRAD